MEFMGWDTYFVFNSKDPRFEFRVAVYNCIVSILKSVLELCCFSDSMVSALQKLAESALVLP